MNRQSLSAGRLRIVPTKRCHASFTCVVPRITPTHPTIRVNLRFTPIVPVRPSLSEGFGARRFCLPAVVSERLVSLSHLMGILTLLERAAGTVHSIEDLTGESLLHGSLGTSS